LGFDVAKSNGEWRERQNSDFEKIDELNFLSLCRELR